MDRRETEELLWELACLTEQERAGGDGVHSFELPDAVLEAYRSGALSAEEMDRVESSLIESTAARERLAALAGLSPPAMSETARRRFLRTLPAPVSVPPDRRRTGPMTSRWFLAAAAVLVTAIAAWWLLFPGGADHLPALLEIEASIQGLAEVRAEPSVRSDIATAEADTAVTVGVVVDPPRAGLEVGLYVFRPDRFAVVRLPQEPVWEDRRKAVFRAPARQLVGDSPGTHQLFAVIGRADGLPPDRIVRPGEEPAVAFAGYDVKVEPLRLELVHGAALHPPASPHREAKEP